MYSILPFSVKNTETLTDNYIKFLKFNLFKKVYIILSNILININTQNFFLKFDFKNLQFNTNQYDIKNINYINTKFNPYYQVNIPIKLKNLTNLKIFNFNFNLLQFPKLDFQGNIILNGLKKTFISKLKRDFGIYFTKTSSIYKASIIFEFNKIITITLTKNNEIKISDFTNKISVDFITFMHFIGISNKEIINFSRYGNSIFLKTWLKKNKIQYKIISENILINLKNLKKLASNFITLNSEFNKNFSNLYAFKISSLIKFKTKQKLDNRFGFNFRDQFIYLFKDLINILDLLIDLKFNKISLNDLDHFGNKKLEVLIDLIINQVDFILEKRIKFLITNLQKSDINLNKFLSTINNYTLNFKEQFNIHPLIQYLDQTNSLSEITHKFKINKSSNLKEITLREIRFSELGKLCLIDTSEGINSGLIVYWPLNILKDKYGDFKTPFKFKTKPFKSFKINSLNSLSQEKINLQLDNLYLKKNLNFNKFNSLQFYKNNFETNSFNLNNFISINKSEIFSFAENLIPFMFFNDPIRSLMGAKMQTQSLPLIYKQKPLILTGNEKLITRKNNNVIYALQEGIVTFSTSYKIVIRDLFNREVSYYLSNYKFSNQHTIINYTPIVWVGERVALGQCIAITEEFKDNEFSIGNNIFILYGSLIGYDFEDAVIINKNLITNNIFSSLHIDCYEINLSFSKKDTPEITSFNIPKYNKYLKRNLDKFGISKEGTKLLENDLLVAKFNFNEIPSYTEALNKFLFTLFGYKLRNIKDTSICISSGNSGRLIKLEMFSNKKKLSNNNYLKLRFFISKQRLLEVGDKLCGRYGNKGVISYISNPVDLPYTEDSLSPDIITSSIGVPSRMNLGQLFETFLSMNWFYLDKRLLIDNNLNSNFGSNYLKSLVYNYTTETNFYNSSIINSYLAGKTFLRDGKTGNILKGSFLFGSSFYTKLIHMVKDKIHYRTIGPYSTITQQPLKGKSNQGGQRFGEMEVWALEAFGAAYNLKELFSIKSDDILSRLNLQEYLLFNYSLKNSNIPESFYLMLNELKGLTLNIESYIISDINKNLFFSTDTFSK
uniref:DNA-directed RNA polymerase subunit beta n=1 Tax=Nephromyces sp. ex Molgula occidentalis TaxID=2544991 RepID=A0A5C1H8B6_9APIC|nr:plastid-encoded DNA-directed RNA polymerase beta [Nephromyces sp. ex Molgula occidentalis]